MAYRDVPHGIRTRAITPFLLTLTPTVRQPPERKWRNFPPGRPLSMRKDEVDGFGVTGLLLRSGCFPPLAVEFLRAYLSRRGYRGTAINNKEPRVNDRIRVPKVRLVGPGGEQVGVVKTEDALRVAVEANLDLVEVAPNSNPPVAKLMDYGKYKYESAQKERAARRNRSNAQLKSIRIGMKIDQNDYNTKKSQAERFLNGGDKVKFDLRFRGREQSRPQLGVELLNGLAEDLAEVSTVESAPRAEGRNMSMVLAPIRKKTEAKSDQRRRREAERETRRQQGAERAKRQQENARANAEARSQQ